MENAQTKEEKENKTNNKTNDKTDNKSQSDKIIKSVKKTKVSQIFVNLPVADLDKSVEFFTKLGFTFNPKFTDKNATCMIIGKNMYSMLLVKDFFKTFTKKEISDATKSTEVLVSLQVKSRKKVDEFVKKAVKAGGTIYAEPFDHGEWMYGHSFADLDGHQWEVVFMDESKMPPMNKDK